MRVNSQDVKPEHRINKQWAENFTKLLSDEERSILATELMFVGVAHGDDENIKIHTIVLLGRDKNHTQKVAAIDVKTQKPLPMNQVPGVFLAEEEEHKVVHVKGVNNETK